jgi:hypothetical protein
MEKPQFGCRKNDFSRLIDCKSLQTLAQKLH